MSEDKRLQTRDFSVSVNRIPSAMNEVQFRQMIRDFGQIEQKGFQQRATTSENAKVVVHIYEVMLQTALAENRVLDIAEQELTTEDFHRFQQDLADVRESYTQAQKDAARIGFGQLNDNIRKTPLTQRSTRWAEFLHEVKDILR